MSEIDAHLGRALRRHRRRRGLTQAQLAAAAGLVHFQQVGKYEAAENRMSAATLFRFARILGMPVADFFAGLPEFRTRPRAAARPEARP